MINNNHSSTKKFLKTSSQIIKNRGANPNEFISFSASLVSLVLEGAVFKKKFISKVLEAFQSREGSLIAGQGELLHLEYCIEIIQEYLEFKSFSKTKLDNYFTSLTAFFDLDMGGYLSLSRNRFPSRIHVETLALCNAKCSFCDYNQLERKGIKMSDEIIEKILGDLSGIPDEHSFVITPYKVSEPFLDRRIAFTTEKFLSFHEGSSVEIISNGNYMPENIIRELQQISNTSLKCLNNKNALSFAFSLNEASQARYESLMKLSHKKTLQNLKRLHKIYSEESFNASIRLTRVSTDAKFDAEFIEFCSINFPNFQCSLLKLNDWSSSNKYASQLLNSGLNHANLYRNLPCHRWTDLSIMANGDLALCCMDSGIDSQHLGNVKTQNCLELYFRKNNQFMPDSLRRKDSPAPCRNCTYFQATSQSKALFKDALHLAISLEKS